MQTEKQEIRLLLTLNEAACCLGLSPRKLWQRSSDGVFSSIKVGRNRRFGVKTIQQWIESKMEEQNDGK